MALRELRHLLRAVDFKPHTLAFRVENLALTVDLDAQAVLESSWHGRPRPTYADSFSAAPWPPGTIRDYYELSLDARLQVLGVSGFTTHETQHRIDFLATPFAAAWHGRACLELLGLQQFEGIVVEELRRAGHVPMRDLPPGDGYRVADGRGSLEARVRWFDAYRGAPQRFVAPGWGGAGTAISLFRREPTPVTVHELLPTVAISDDGQYLRPLTILEGRAVAVSALQLLTRLGSNQRAAVEVAAYLREFYSPREEYLDYRFLFELFASLWGEGDFFRAAEERGAKWLTQALQTTIIVGWYALHAPPLMPGDTDDGVVNSSPVYRLLLALQEIERTVARGHRFETGVDLLNAVDGNQKAQEHGLVAGDAAIAYSVSYIEALRKWNANENLNRSLREHFDRLFGVVHRQLSARSGRGFASRLGMPDSGDLIAGFRESPTPQDFLPDEHEPSHDATRWFALRETLHFRHARPPGFWDSLDEFIGPIRHRFVAGARVPEAFEPDYHGGPLVHLSEPLPAELETDAELSVTWGICTDGGEVFLRVEIDSAQLSRPYALVFVGSAHSDLVRTTAASGRLLLKFTDASVLALHLSVDEQLVEAFLELAGSR